MSLRKNDTVLILAGRDRGKKGKILQVLPAKARVVVEGVNLLTKHARPRKQRQKGERVQFSAPMAAANVQLICPHCGKATRPGYRMAAGKKERFCRQCQSPIR